MAPQVTLPIVLVVLGVGLLASPIAVFHADIGEPEWEYAAVEIVIEGDTMTIPDAAEIPGDPYIDNIVCTDATRSCAVEQYINADGDLAVGDASFTRTPYQYAIIDDVIVEAAYYEEDGVTYLTHEEADPNDAVRRSSASYERAHPAYRAAIEEGSTTANQWVETPQVITVDPNTPDERFYYVYEVRSPSPGDYEPTFGDRALTWTLSIIGFVAGLGLVLHGQVMRIRRQEWYRQFGSRRESDE